MVVIGGIIANGCCVIEQTSYQPDMIVVASLAMRPSSFRGIHDSFSMTHQRMRAFQQRVNEVNAVSGDVTFVPFQVMGTKVGEVFSETSKLLAQYNDVFSMGNEGELMLTPELEASDSAVRTEAVAKVVAGLRERGVISGWRNELVEVCPKFGEPAAFMIERAAYPLFGVPAYGVFVNGFVRDALAPGGMKVCD